MTHWDYSDCRSVEQAAGACFFVRREAYEQIGGFDPAYFMYFEDTDFCIRLRRAGWPIYYLPQAKIRHHLGASSGREWQARAQMIAAYNHSRYYYFHRYGGPAQGKWLKAFVLLGASLRLAAWSIVALKRPAAREQMRIFLEVWRRAWRMRPEMGSD
jgi:N-acetylglucosaminyl-diphospho-decaprenol L-rhamnosyltransferase